MKRAGKISMGSAKQDQRYVGLRGSESFGDLGLRHRAAELADFGRFFLGQKFTEPGDAADVDGVLFVGSVIDPFKIIGPAVRFDAIDMVDEREFVRVGDEGDCDQSVDVDGFVSTVLAKVGLQVPEFIDARFENLAVNSSWPSPANVTLANPIKASKTPKIAHFVKSDEASNASPFFNHEASLAWSPYFIDVSNVTQGG